MKLMLRESGTTEARSLYFSASRLLSSRLLVTESRAALARARRSGRLSARALRLAVAEAHTYLAEVEPVELDVTLAEHAGELAETYELRAYDAVHLASYELIESEDAVLVAADGYLIRAARSIGHAVAVPGT